MGKRLKRKKAKKYVRKMLKRHRTPVPPIIHGAPGVSKSRAVYQMLGSERDPDDVRGPIQLPPGLAMWHQATPRPSLHDALMAELRPPAPMMTPERQRWNIAADLCVNQVLQDLPESQREALRLHELGHKLFDRKATFEEVYELLGRVDYWRWQPAWHDYALDAALYHSGLGGADETQN